MEKVEEDGKENSKGRGERKGKRRTVPGEKKKKENEKWRET